MNIGDSTPSIDDAQAKVHGDPFAWFISCKTKLPRATVSSSLARMAYEVESGYRTKLASKEHTNYQTSDKTGRFRIHN